MKKLLISAIAAFGVIGTPALAADMAVKAPPSPPPAPVYSWTGWYVGGNVGYSWGRANTDFAGSIDFVSLNLSGGANLVTPFAFGGSNAAHLNGVIGGGQIGYDYQLSTNVVLGFEADIQGSGERGSGQVADSFIATICISNPAPGGCTDVPTNFTALTNYEVKIDWFGTVRGRLGFLVSDQLLIYGTGGLAYGKIAVSGGANISAVAPIEGVQFTPATPPFGASKTNVGFSVGAGVEGRLYWLPQNWTWKLEYLYVDLGSLDTTTSFAMAPPVTSGNLFPAPATGTFTTHTHFTDNILRVGLNFQFH